MIAQETNGLSGGVGRSDNGSRLRELGVDAFAQTPSWASRVAGLGGGDAPDDLSYVFRTLAASPAPGRVIFNIRFQGLVATCGTLVLQITAVSVFPGAAAAPLRTIHLSLTDLVAAGGAMSVELTARRNTLYAVAGNVYDETDAVAKALAITRVDSGAAREVGEAKSVKLDIDQRPPIEIAETETVGRLLNLDAPTLLQPVSQGWTARQCKEAPFKEWLGALKLSVEPSAANWQAVFILQSLRRYGALRKGATGLGFTGSEQSLPSLMATYGCSVLVVGVDQTRSSDVDPGLALEQYFRPRICPPELFFERVNFTALNPSALPEELGLFDFMWSNGVVDQLQSVGDVQDFIERSMSKLKPGGLAVHMFRQAHDSGLLSNGAFALGRPDIERVALALLSYGNEVAQLKFGYRENASVKRQVEIPFGLIARRC